jgi:hypothetical protein
VKIDHRSALGLPSRCEDNATAAQKELKMRPSPEEQPSENCSMLHRGRRGAVRGAVEGSKVSERKNEVGGG